MSNFISNSENKKLETRISELISLSKELKFLVGFFYFSGYDALFNSLKLHYDLPVKILVGLDCDKINYQVIEHAEKKIKKVSDEKILSRFFDSVRNTINSDEFDSERFYSQIYFFIDKIKNGTLTIRKTRQPNHSKLYLFKLNENQFKKTVFITGSSNLTKAGLSSQNEFNVEISDYGFEEAEKYFDNLWDNSESIKITEDEQIKTKLIEILENETHIRKFTPFEAYVYVLKSYIDTYEFKDIREHTKKLMEKRGYKPYQYQLDAISLALSVIEKYNGVILSDVVGLGKTVIACAIGQRLQKRGMVICPPNLIGDKNKKSGWKKYLEEFELYDWEIRSCGDLEKTLEFVNHINSRDIEVIIIDEAHRFRNEDTQSYELLKNICRGKIVILLTATPFNNKPADIFSLLKLFTIPKKSDLVFDEDIEATFTSYKTIFKDLAYISRYLNSKDLEKRNRAKKLYKKHFNEDFEEFNSEGKNLKIRKVKNKTKELASEIRSVIEPVVIRRNRLDLIKNPNYKNEVKDLPEVKDPEQWFYELTQEQSKFYDQILQNFFADPEDGGVFSGAIYRPFCYEEGIFSSEDLLKINQFLKAKGLEELNINGEEKNRELNQQQNLFTFMRRILVKRFESSFGAFYESVKNFEDIHKKVANFIIKTGKGNPYEGKYYLIRDLINKVNEASDEDYEEIEKSLIEYEKIFSEKFEEDEMPRKEKPYFIKNFKEKKRFIEDINKDVELFSNIIKKVEELNLVENDPKARCLVENLKSILSEKPSANEPKRKIIIFSEFADTVKYLQGILERENFRVLTICGQIPDSKIEEIYANFDASYGIIKDSDGNIIENLQKDDYDILLGTDKISEGFNLNRAGIIINYDIPWNPVRVIQRLGRINRISKRVFKNLYIANFFPTEQGADIIKSKEIAQNKMFMIHTILGEDAKIFDVDESPTASGLYSKLIQNPENSEEESFFDKKNNEYQEIKEKYPQIVQNLNNIPNRIKVARLNDNNNLIVIFKTKRLFAITYDYNTGEIKEEQIENVLEKIRCESDEESIEIDNNFWEAYEKIKEYKKPSKGATSEQSVYIRAKNNIDFIIRNFNKIRENSSEIYIYKKFVEDIKEDMIYYGTLSDFTLRRIANLSTDIFNINSNQINGIYDIQKKLEKLIDEIKELEQLLGKDFLEKEKERINKIEKEIIIAYENKLKQKGNIYAN